MTLHRAAWPGVAMLVLLAGCGKPEQPIASAPPSSESTPSTEIIGGTYTAKDGKVYTGGTNYAATGKQHIEAVPPPKFDLAKAKPDFSMDVKEWLAEWQDPKAAEEKFNLKVVEISGEVERFGLVKRGEKECAACMFLKTGPAAKDPVMLLMEEKEPWARVSPGSKVKVKAVAAPPPLFFPTPGRFVEAGPNPAVVATAVNLARDFAGNKDAAEETYQDKTVILSGEIAQLEIIDKQRFALKLKNDSGVDIVCDFAPIAGDTNDAGILLGQVTKGQRVTVVGQCSMLDDVKLKNCLPITGAK